MQPTEPLRILVVDDNVDAAETLAFYLEAHGYTTRVVHDGEEAVRSAEDFEPDVLLLDLGLPKLDGYEVALAIRAAPWGQDVWICAITAWAAEQDRGISFAAGMNHHLLKPVAAPVVLKLIREVEEARANRER